MAVPKKRTSKSKTNKRKKQFLFPTRLKQTKKSLYLLLLALNKKQYALYDKAI